MIHSHEVNSSTAQSAREYLAGWQRARAELDNFRKQVAEQHHTGQTRQLARAITEFLPLADNFQAITNHVPAELKDNPWVQGVLHVSRQFQDILGSLGVTEINKSGVPFDPKLHEAVDASNSGDQAKDRVAAIVRTGYRLGEFVIRPAQVQVK